MADQPHTSCQTVVVGAGISGLCTALGLRKRGRDVTVLEATGRSGGVIESKRVGPFLFEYGPNSLLKKSTEVEQLIAELDLQSAVQVAGDQASRRYVVRDGTLHPVPMSAGAFLTTDLLSWRGKLSLLLEPFRKPGGHGGDESLASFVERRLGEEALTYLVNPMIAGVYAGDPGEMSAISGAEKFAGWEREYGSILKGALSSKLEEPDRSGDEGVDRQLISFKGGIDTLTKRLSQRLEDVIRYNHTVQSVARSPGEGGYQLSVNAGGTTETYSTDRLVICVPAFAAAQMLGTLDQDVASTLNRIDYPPVSVVHFGYESYNGAHPLDGFGFLVPEAEQRRILGSLWNATIFPGRAPDGGAVFTTFVGGARQPELARKPDDELIDVVRSDLEDLVGIGQEPDVAHVKRWDRAIPQYNLGHQRIMQEVDRFEDEHPGIHLNANYRNGVSVPACIQKGLSLAGEIEESDAE